MLADISQPQKQQSFGKGVGKSNRGIRETLRIGKSLRGKGGAEKSILGEKNMCKISYKYALLLISRLSWQSVKIKCCAHVAGIGVRKYIL